MVELVEVEVLFSSSLAPRYEQIFSQRFCSVEFASSIRPVTGHLRLDARKHGRAYLGDRGCWSSVLSKEAPETYLSRDGSRDGFREERPLCLPVMPPGSL